MVAAACDCRFAAVAALHAGLRGKLVWFYGYSIGSLGDVDDSLLTHTNIFAWLVMVIFMVGISLLSTFSAAKSLLVV